VLRTSSTRPPLDVVEPWAAAGDDAADDLVDSFSASGRVPRGGADDDAACAESGVQGEEKGEDVDPSPLGSVSLGAAGACSCMPIFGRSFGKGVPYSGNASLNL